MNKYLPVVLLTPLYVGVILFFGLMIYSLQEPVEINVIDWSKDASAGEEIKVINDVTWNKECHHSTRKYLQNKETFLVSSDDIEHSPAHEPKFIELNKVPVSIPEGDYNLIIKIRTSCDIFDTWIPHEKTLGPFPIKIRNKPVEIKETLILNPIVEENKPLIFSVRYIRNRECIITNYRFIFDSDGTLVESSSRPDTYREINKDITIKEELKLSISPGKYTLQSIILSQCIDNIYRQELGSAEFTVKKS